MVGAKTYGPYRIAFAASALYVERKMKSFLRTVRSPVAVERNPNYHYLALHVYRLIEAGGWGGSDAMNVRQWINLPLYKGLAPAYFVMQS
jgi:hypothetical protein